MQTAGEIRLLQKSGWLLGMVLVAGPVARITAGAEARALPLQIKWANNMLTVAGAEIPGGSVQIWYLEAFCRRGSTAREWPLTTFPHRTELISATATHIRLRSFVESHVEVEHEISAGTDEVDFRMTLHNRGRAFVDVEWLQPCLRVDRFTGRKQSNYIDRSFIFTRAGLTTLDKTRRTEEAIYHGGQVYVPEGINLKDVNPRPISPDRPINGLIGCFSADGQWLLATAWDHTQELFQGVIVCLHNDPRVGGLDPGATKPLHGKLYFLRNDPEALLGRYRRDFPQP